MKKNIGIAVALLALVILVLVGYKNPGIGLAMILVAFVSCVGYGIYRAAKFVAPLVIARLNAAPAAHGHGHGGGHHATSFWNHATLWVVVLGVALLTTMLVSVLVGLLVGFLANSGLAALVAGIASGILFIIALVATWLIAGGWQTVHAAQNEEVYLETLGHHGAQIHSGLLFIVPGLERLHRYSLERNEVSFPFELRTSDGGIKFSLSVLYRVVNGTLWTEQSSAAEDAGKGADAHGGQNGGSHGPSRAALKQTYERFLQGDLSGLLTAWASNPDSNTRTCIAQVPQLGNAFIHAHRDRHIATYGVLIEMVRPIGTIEPTGNLKDKWDAVEAARLDAEAAIHAARGAQASSAAPGLADADVAAAQAAILKVLTAPKEQKVTFTGADGKKRRMSGLGLTEEKALAYIRLQRAAEDGNVVDVSVVGADEAPVIQTIANALGMKHLFERMGKKPSKKGDGNGDSSPAPGAGAGKGKK